MNHSLLVLILALLCINQAQSMTATELNYYFSRSNDLALIQTDSNIAININIYNGLDVDLTSGANYVLKYAQPWSNTASRICKGCKVSNKYIGVGQKVSSVNTLDDWTSLRI